MPDIIFTHPKLDETLVITTGANQIQWSYNLITQAYPTYGGEVLQVLATNIDNLTIQGEVTSYRKMEQIYAWFLRYMQRAAQGAGGVAYTEDPVTMQYPERGWTIGLKPINLPQLRYGRDVVIPTWQLQAHVVDPDPEQAELTIDAAIHGGLSEFRNDGIVSADIGFRLANPFSDPLGVLTKEEHEIFPKAANAYEGQKNPKDPDTGEALKGLAKQMNDVFNRLLDGDFSDLIDEMGLDESSKPVTRSKSARDGGATEQTKNSNTKGARTS